MCVCVCVCVCVCSTGDAKRGGGVCVCIPAQRFSLYKGLWHTENAHRQRTQSLYERDDVCVLTCV